MLVDYTKVDSSNPSVVKLAEQLQDTPEHVATIINQQRYRKAYNRTRNAENRRILAAVRSNPTLKELVDEAK